MVIPGNIFRQYDIRGKAQAELTQELVVAIGQTFARMVQEGTSRDRSPRIVVGRDCRLSSPSVHAALTEGLVSAGAHVIDVGIGPTPMLYFAVFHLDADGGIMVTGSHNPVEDNGFKMMFGKAPFFGRALAELRARLALFRPGSDPGGRVQHARVDEAYVARLAEGIDLTASGLRVVVDAGNGAAGPCGLAALRAVGLEPEALFCEPDGSFPNHHPDPIEEANLAALRARVIETGADLGIGWDGDGDRVGVVDGSAQVVSADQLLMLFARDILERHPGAAILGDVKCSQTLYDDVLAHGGRPVFCKTGHSNIKTQLKEEGALLAGEMSGHIFFADRYYGYDDAIYASVRLLDVLARSGVSLRELLDRTPRACATPEIRVECPERIKFDVVTYVREHFARTHEVLDVDGARVLFGGGAWGLVRASNSGPFLVLRFEADDEGHRDALRREVERVVAAARQALES